MFNRTLARVILVAFLCYHVASHGNSANIRADSTGTLVTTTLVAGCSLTAEGAVRFQTALTSWLKVRSLQNIVIVSWHSAVNMTDLSEKTVRTVGSTKQVTIVTMPERGRGWRIGSVYNLGFHFVKARQVLKVDCDTELSATFLQRNSLVTHGNVLRYGDYRASRTENDRHLNGVFLTHTELLKSVGGFDERFELYGWDDSDLYLRLLSQARGQSSISANQLEANFTKSPRGNTTFEGISHISHARRTCGECELITTCFNRAVSEQVSEWRYQSSVTNSLTQNYSCVATSVSRQVQNIVCKPLYPATVALQHAIDITTCRQYFRDCALGNMFEANYGYHDEVFLARLVNNC